MLRIKSAVGARHLSGGIDNAETERTSAFSPGERQAIVTTIVRRDSEGEGESEGRSETIFSRTSRVRINYPLIKFSYP